MHTSPDSGYEGNELVDSQTGQTQTFAGGNQTIYGGSGTDLILASNGDDYIDAGSGRNTTVQGGMGNDTIFGDTANVTVFGGGGFVGAPLAAPALICLDSRLRGNDKIRKAA